MNRRRALQLAAGAMMLPSLRTSATEQPGGFPREETSFGSLPLKLRGGASADVETIVLCRPPELHVLHTSKGVVRRNENRVDIREVPLAGGFFRRTYRPIDFPPGGQIGSAYLERATLFVFLAPTLSTPPMQRTLVVLNSRFSFTFNDTAQALGGAALGIYMPDFTAIPIVARAVQAQGGLSAREESVLAGLNDGPSPLDPMRAGVAHERERELMVRIRPSIAAGDRE